LNFEITNIREMDNIAVLDDILASKF